MHLGGKDYWRCEQCEARGLVAAHLPDAATERATYRLHQNSIQDIGYRRFLAKLSDPLLARVPVPARGLDYGCGPGPALAAMLREAGHEMSLYDPIFQPDPAALSERYDFVTCTEVAEHFHHPAAEFDRLAGLLHPGGWLAVMTCFQTDDARFEHWHYRQDPTHVVFYRAQTFEHIAQLRGWSCTIPHKDVALLRMPLA